MSRTEALPGPPASATGRKRSLRYGDPLFISLTRLFAVVLVALLAGLLAALVIDAWPAIEHFGLSFLTSTQWNAVTQEFGALPAIYGTLLTSIIGLVIAVPVSLGAAIFLVELAPPWLRGPVSFLIELLAAVPSVIIGLWGMFVLVPFVREGIEGSWIGRSLSFLPLFQGPPFGVGFLAAGMVLAIMIIPIITAISRDAITAVPDHQREAMLALGATRWETVARVVLPYSRSGLVGGVMLGLGRALGETMAVTMVIGNSYKLSPSLFSPGSTIASKIALEFSEASGGLFVGSLVELALILFGVTLLVNVAARLLVWRMSSVRGVEA